MSNPQLRVLSTSDSTTDIDDIVAAEECVRYYPPNLEIGIEPEAVFRVQEDIPRREIDLFVDVPFCETICGFCPFNVYPAANADIQGYLAAVTGEVKLLESLYDFERIPVRTVWVGGGTPSILTEASLDALLRLLSNTFDMTGVREFTVEIKPTLSALSESKLALLLSHGVTRISMGVQSTSQSYLDLLGRGHTAADAAQVVRLVKGAGFELNIDMIYRLPGQTLAEVAEDVDSVRALQIDHLSWFPYVSHDGTALAKKLELGRVAPQADRQAYLTMFNVVADHMAAAGYQQYTPYYFTNGRPCEYHVGRWSVPQRETLGIGAGAFSFFNGWIYANEHSPQRYKQRVDSRTPPVVSGKKLSVAENITRVAVLGIKFFSLSQSQFERETGVRLLEYYARELDLLQRLGLVDIEGDAVVCTQLGRAFNNDVATVFSTDTAKRTKHPQAIDFIRLK